MPYSTKEVCREILLAFWKVHILHHASEEPLHGQWMLKELRHHGYEISPGTLYPLLARMERLGWLQSKANRRANPRARKDYRLTGEGRKVLEHVREQIAELYDEVMGEAKREKGNEFHALSMEEMVSLFSKTTATKAPSAVLLIRLLVGAVFLSEGIQKFLFPAEVGAGRFAKIGLPSPEFLAPFVGTFEIVCGSLVLIGLFTRFAVIPLLTIMAVAFYTTKLPILLQDGFWKMAHEGRADFSMTMCLSFLLIVGAGACSLDARRAKNESTRHEEGRPIP